MLFSPDIQNRGTTDGTPVIENGIVYRPCGYFETFLSALKMPETAGDKLKPTRLYRIQLCSNGKIGAGGENYCNYTIASPLIHEGLAYYITMGGILRVTEADTGTLCYMQILDDMHPTQKWVLVNGVCSSPALAGSTSS